MTLPHYKTRICKVYILDNKTIETTLAAGEILELEDIIEVIDICKIISKNTKHHSLMVPGENSNITGEARNYLLNNVEWAASLSLVSTSLAHRLLFNYTIKHLQKMPAKIHASSWQAHKWIEEIDTP